MAGVMEARMRQSIRQGRPNYISSYFSKEVANSTKEEAGLPVTPVASESVQAVNGLANKVQESPKETPPVKTESLDVPVSPRVKAPHSILTSTVKKPLGAKKTGKTSGLGARKLTSKPSESLYDQKPEEAPVQVCTSTNSNPPEGSSLASRFEYTVNVPVADTGSGGTHVISHVAPPKSSGFFSDYGMQSALQKKNTSSSKVQIEETDEARKKFSNAKSISLSQFFGDQNKDADSQVSLQKFSAQQDISSLKNMAGETGKKLSSLASSFMNDFQDRVL